MVRRSGWRPAVASVEARELRFARRAAWEAELAELDVGSDPVPSGPALGKCDTHVGSDAFWEVEVLEGQPARLMCPRCFAPYADRLAS